MENTIRPVIRMFGLIFWGFLFGWFVGFVRVVVVIFSLLWFVSFVGLV